MNPKKTNKRTSQTIQHNYCYQWQNTALLRNFVSFLATQKPPDEMSLNKCNSPKKSNSLKMC